jgi:phage antirepressor YoqD-like protein
MDFIDNQVTKSSYEKYRTKSIVRKVRTNHNCTKSYTAKITTRGIILLKNKFPDPKKSQNLICSPCKFIFKLFFLTFL